MILSGRINAVFGSSMEVEVKVFSETPLTGQRRLTTRAFVTMVAIGDDGRPHRAARLELRDDDEKRRAANAEERRAARLALRESAD